MIANRTKPAHPSDEDLLLVVDRECSPSLAAEVREHLSQCAPCLHRMRKFENTLEEFIAFHERRVQLQAPATARLRTSLKSRLKEERRPTTPPLSWIPPTILPRHLIAAAALLIIAGSLWAMREGFQHRPDATTLAIQWTGILPRRLLTPGAVRSIQVSELCGSQDFENDPPVDAKLRQAVFQEYGLVPSSDNSYQVDYLISPTLGGAATLENLWPQPETSTAWDARTKDALESHLHEMVCEGKLPLSTAQNAISADWIAAYKQYFHSEVPLSSTATLVLPQAPN